MKYQIKNFVGLLGLLLASSCGNENFNKVEQIGLASSPGGFRVLGIRADNPEMSLTGGTTQLSLYIVDPQSAARTVTGSYEICLDSGIARGADVSCQGQTTVSGTYDIDTVSLSTHGEFRYGFTNPLSVTLPNVSNLATDPKAALNGVSYIVIFSLQTGSSTQVSFTRIVGTSRIPLNQNPTATTVLVNNQAPQKNLKNGDVLTTQNTSAESFQQYTTSGVLENRTENYKIAWYTTIGEFDRPKASLGDAVTFKGETNSNDQLLFALTRDERGGLSVASFELQN